MVYSNLLFGMKSVEGLLGSHLYDLLLHGVTNIFPLGSSITQREDFGTIAFMDDRSIMRRRRDDRIYV